jgi:hypothetical protein
MFIIIPSGTIHTATATGAVVKEILCEACGEPYTYMLTRTATAEESALFMQRRAERVAAEKARRKLARILETDHDEVPCPSCGQFQSHMLAAIRRRSYAELRNLGNALLLFAAVVAAIMLAMLVVLVFVQDRPIPDSDTVNNCMLAVGIIAAPGLLLHGLRRGLLAMYQPNISHR